jgi:hypothetical protein
MGAQRLENPEEVGHHMRKKSVFPLPASKANEPCEPGQKISAVAHG